MKVPEKNYIIIQRGTDSPELRWTEDQTPIGFAGFLYDAMGKYVKDDDHVLMCGDVRFDHTRPWYLPNIVLEGIPRNGLIPTIHTSCCIDSANGKPETNTPSIVLKTRNAFRNLHLIGRCSIPGEDAAITGHIQSGDTYVLFEDCLLNAEKDQDWGAYYRWTGNTGSTSVVILRRVSGYFSRFLISLCPSASPLSRLSVENSGLYGDADGSYTIGATNSIAEESAVCPILMRSGTAKFAKVHSRVSGHTVPPRYEKYAPKRAVGLITNVYSSKASPVTVTGSEVTINLHQELCSEKSDFDLRYGSPLPVIDNSVPVKQAKGGSQPDGEFLVKQ